MPGSDSDKRRRDRERRLRRVEDRIARGVCTRCAARRPVDGGRTCEGCRRKRRKADRARAERRRAAGIRRVRDPDARRAEYVRARQRAAVRVAAGMCTKCGSAKLEPGRRLCARCGEKRRRRERARYAAAKAAGAAYGLSGAPDNPYYPERGFIPSDMPETALPCGFRAHRLGICLDRFCRVSVVLHLNHMEDDKCHQHPMVGFWRVQSWPISTRSSLDSLTISEFAGRLARVTPIFIAARCATS